MIFEPLPKTVLKPEHRCPDCGDPKQDTLTTCFACAPLEVQRAWVGKALDNDLRFQARLRAVREHQTVVVRTEARAQAAKAGIKSLNVERKNGAKVIYPNCKQEVPTIWTPKTCYPYPNWRRKLGLAPSYPTAECRVVYPGWYPGQKPK